jgi:hypothetical protein
MLVADWEVMAGMRRMEVRKSLMTLLRPSHMLRRQRHIFRTASGKDIQHIGEMVAHPICSPLIRVGLLNVDKRMGECCSRRPRHRCRSARALPLKKRIDVLNDIKSGRPSASAT